MLYNLDWLKENAVFPPESETKRFKRYEINERFFTQDLEDHVIDVYKEWSDNIGKIIGNINEYINLPVVLNYQKLLSLKTADLVCSEYPIITGKDTDETSKINDLRESVDFDQKLYTGALNMSIYGDLVLRCFPDDEDPTLNTFVPWSPKEWIPIVRNDGTLRIYKHVLFWIETPNSASPDDKILHIQIHDTGSDGRYVYKKFHLKNGKIGPQIGKDIEQFTGFKYGNVLHVANIRTTISVYGLDDYTMINSLVQEAMERVSQIANILDEHADPSMQGPSSFLTRDKSSGRLVFKKDKYYARDINEPEVNYVTWDGKLTDAFDELEFLLNQIYILSEMGSALLGVTDKTGQAISGTAMRFKMTNPLIKARRLTNALTLPVKRLLSNIDDTLDIKKITIQWLDGLPKDPREEAERARLESGSPQIKPLEEVLMDTFDISSEKAENWVEVIKKQQEWWSASNKAEDVDNGLGNPKKKGSTTGMNNFKSPANNHLEEK